MPNSILPNYQTEDIFIQPQLVRYHHPWRSPMGSEKINLEISQFRFDIFKLYELFNDLETSKLDLFSALDNGIGSEIPAVVSDSILGLHDSNVRIQRLIDRVEIIEKGL